jgi:hypothetical protein
MAKKQATKRPRLNDEKVKSLFKKLKSVTQVAEKVGGSYAGVRNNLIRQGVIKG